MAMQTIRITGKVHDARVFDAVVFASRLRCRYGGLWKNRKAAVAAAPRSIVDAAADHASLKHAAQAAADDASPKHTLQPPAPSPAYALPSQTARATACNVCACVRDDACPLQLLPSHLSSLNL